VVLSFVFELKYSVLLKIWLAYPLFCCTGILVSVCNDHFFDTGTDGIADEFVEDHLE